MHQRRATRTNWQITVNVEASTTQGKQPKTRSEMRAFLKRVHGLASMNLRGTRTDGLHQGDWIKLTDLQTYLEARKLVKLLKSYGIAAKRFGGLGVNEIFVRNDARDMAWQIAQTQLSADDSKSSVEKTRRFFDVLIFLGVILFIGVPVLLLMLHNFG